MPEQDLEVYLFKPSLENRSPFLDCLRAKGSDAGCKARLDRGDSFERAQSVFVFQLEATPVRSHRSDATSLNAPHFPHLTT